MIDLIIGGVIGGAGTIIIKLAYDGSKWGKKSNGHMTEDKCEARMGKLTDIIESDRKDLHEKINKTANVVSRVEGYLDGKDKS